ncbi:Protein of uncharacterised function (DUF2500) [Chlamydia abortus]|uniref:DUF2500 domain-containing protein n=1 Tax=Paenibacillus residui TaxID=629724 RepID=A0ABW3DDV7_9BACL|nr:Protein of uncharacterised function (DUF2500) [Chlamydia abortus]
MFDMGPSFGGGFSMMSSIIPILVVVVFAVVLIGIVMNGARYVKNASSPRESVFARVVAKRMEVRTQSHHHHHENGHVHPGHSSRTYYYITLEFENGERKEYLDVRNLYGLIIEGDSGYAAVQGDWIVAFERNGGN